MNERIEIELSRTKGFILFIGSIAFVLFGTFLFLHPEKFASSSQTVLLFVKVMGLISVVFFGICAVFIFRNFFIQKIGLIIDQHGITNRSTAFSIGLVGHYRNKYHPNCFNTNSNIKDQ